MRIAIDINDVIRDFSRQFRIQYQKHIDSSFEIDDSEINDFDLFEVFPFESRDAYNKFRYIDYPLEIYGRAEPMDKMLPYRFNDWIQNYLRDLDEENIPEVMLVSPFEANLTIQATFAFLSVLPCRVREIYFPIDSATIWDRCDILITANPNLIESVPDGKTVIKINAPYNTDTECEYSFNSMMDVINDENDTVINLIENGNA